jgi:hypothetical protein
MPLPVNFKAFEHLQDKIRGIHNKDVAEYFRDVADDDISTKRGSLKVGCKIDDDDTVQMMILRMWLFEFTVGRGRRLEPASLGESESQLNYTVLRKTKPLLTLHFKEDAEDAEAGYQQLKGRIGIRLMNQTTDTISKAEAEAYGRKVKTLFGSGTGFIWKKGKYLCSYADWDKGYQLQLYCKTEAEGKRIVEQVLDIQGHSPQWEYFDTKTNNSPTTAYPTTPPKQLILGKSQRLPRRRPVGDVRYQYATLAIAGASRQLVIHDRSYRFREALNK